MIHHSVDTLVSARIIHIIDLFPVGALREDSGTEWGLG